MARLVTGALNKRMRVRGSYTLNPVNVPLGITTVTLSMERDSWPVRVGTGATETDRILDSEVMRMRADISYDGGVNWKSLCIVGAPGGDVTEPDPANESQTRISPFTSVTFRLKEPTNPNRMVRGELTLREGLSTQVHIDAD